MTLIRTTNSKPSRQPSQADQERVHDAFDPDMLAHLCTTWDFTDYATETSWGKNGKFYWYQDNGSDILAVAHLDSVQDDTSCKVVYTSAGPLALSGALDDRLGVYVILDLLPTLGVTCDWLLTTDEERGQSTAREFAEDFVSEPGHKQYNWIIEFDRGGTDVVMYDYETAEYGALVEAAGARMGVGSFSDIVELESLGCAAFNWGVAYEDYHGPRSHAWLNDTFRMVARFLQFHEQNATTFLPHEPQDWRTRPLTGGTDPDDDDWVWYGTDPIEVDCGHMVDLDDDDTYEEWGSDYVICRSCADSI